MSSTPEGFNPPENLDNFDVKYIDPETNSKWGADFIEETSYVNCYQDNYMPIPVQYNPETGDFELLAGTDYVPSGLLEELHDWREKQNTQINPRYSEAYSNTSVR